MLVFITPESPPKDPPHAEPERTADDYQALTPIDKEQAIPANNRRIPANENKIGTSNRLISLPGGRRGFSDHCHEPIHGPDHICPIRPSGRSHTRVERHHLDHGTITTTVGSCGPGDSFVQPGYSGTLSFIDTPVGPDDGDNLLSGSFAVTGSPSTTGAQFSSVPRSTAAGVLTPARPRAISVSSY
jgi:hypothetical protein